MGPFDSVSGCRLHHQLQPNVLMVEPKCDPLMVRRLQDLGHKIRVLDKDSFGTSVNMVAAASGDNYTDISEIEWVAISDERKGGVGAGW